MYLQIAYEYSYRYSLPQYYQYLLQKPFALSSLGRLYILVMLIKFLINRAISQMSYYIYYIHKYYIVPHTLDIFKMSSYKPYVNTLVAHQIYNINPLYTL